MQYRIKRNDDELFHSDDYLGNETTNGLYHYKYIDKYKSKAGKWIYVYKKKLKDSIGLTAKESYEKAKVDQDNAEWRAKATARAANAQNDFENDLRKNWSNNFSNKAISGKFTKDDPDYEALEATNRLYNLSGNAEYFIGTGKKYNPNVTSGQRAAGEAVNARLAKAKADIAKSKYDKTFLGRYEKVINKGKDFVKNLLRIH